jgi:hypothetical protein
MEFQQATGKGKRTGDRRHIRKREKTGILL